MPLFEFNCRSCGADFEELVRTEADARCPKCKGADLEKKLSVFAKPVAASSSRADLPPACQSCGDPRGPGACGMAR